MSGFSDTARPSWPGRGLVALLDAAAATHARAVAALVALTLIVFLPGFFTIPPIDRDEARFAQATKQMVATGDLVDIRFQGEVRYKKPVGIYWLQTAAVKTAVALGIKGADSKIWIYRLPSLLGAIGGVLLTYWCALAFVPRRGAVLAAAMMASSILLGVEARLAKTDAMLLASVVAAMGAMARIYFGARRTPDQPASWAMPAVFWTALAAGFLIKGPLIVMFVGLTVLTLGIVDRSAGWLWRLRPVSGLVWFAVLVLPWFIAILERSGGTYFAESVGRDMWAKVVSSQESHGAPPGLYLVLYWATFWPGAVLTGLAIPAIWTSRRQLAARFLLAWLVPSWIVLELAITKLPHYVLPLYPAIAILLAGAVEARVLVRNRWISHGTIWWFVVPAVLSVLGIVAAVAVGRQLALIAWPLLAAGMVLGLVAWLFYDSRRSEPSVLYGIGASVAMAVGLYGLLIPSVPQLFPAVALAEVVAEADCPEPQVAAAGYHEPSLVFLVGTHTRLTDAGGAADFLHGGACRIAFIEHRLQRAFVKRAEDIGLRYAPGPKIEGFNISGGRMINVLVYRSEPVP